MLEGWEWLIIGIIAIVIIMWGPAKIPELAKSLGRAKGEFNRASKEFTDAATEATKSPAIPTTAVATQPATNTIKTKDEMLLDTAKSLGIEINGKTREQISEEIGIKIKLLGSE